jgi:hypothetical protein
MKSKKKILVRLVLSTIALLVVLWFALESGIRWHINKKIDESEQVSGNVGAVSINPLEGLYSVNAIDLSYTSDAIDMPVIDIRSAVLCLNWETFFSGALVGRMKIIRPDFRIVQKSSPKKEKAPEGPPLSRTFKTFIPIQVDLIRITDGELRMCDKTHKEPLEIDITQINGEIRNLTNKQNLSEDLFASAKIIATVLESGILSMKLKIAPAAEDLYFSLICGIKGIRLLNLNSFLNDLAGITFEGGTLNIDINLNAENGFVKGFVETVYQNVKFSEPENDGGILERLKEGISDLLGEIIENKEGSVVTRVPVNMKVQGTKPDVLFTVMLTLQKALVNAIVPIVGNMAAVE